MSVPTENPQRPGVDRVPVIFPDTDTLQESDGRHQTELYRELQELRESSYYLRPETGHRISELHRLIWNSSPQPITRYENPEGNYVDEIPYWLIPDVDNGNSREFGNGNVRIVSAPISSIPMHIRALQADIVANNYGRKLLHLPIYANTTLFASEPERERWLHRREQDLTRAMCISREGQINVYLLANDQDGQEVLCGTIGSVRGVHGDPVLDMVGHDGTVYGEKPSSLPTHSALSYDTSTTPSFVKAYLANKPENVLAETTRLCVHDKLRVEGRQRLVFPNLLYATQFYAVPELYHGVETHIFNTPEKITKRLATLGYSTFRTHQPPLVPTPGIMQTIHSYYFRLFSTGKLPNGQPYPETTEAHVLDAAHARTVSENILTKYGFQIL